MFVQVVKYFYVGQTIAAVNDIEELCRIIAIEKDSGNTYLYVANIVDPSLNIEIDPRIPGVFFWKIYNPTYDELVVQ